MTFRAIMKNGTFQFKISVDSFWANIGKIGLLLISTPGHTGWGLVLVVWPDLAKFSHFGKIKNVFGNFLRVYSVLENNWTYLSYFSDFEIVSNG